MGLVLDCFVDKLRSTATQAYHHLLMFQTVHFIEASVVNVLF